MPSCHLTLRGQKPAPEGYPTAPTTLGDHLKRRRLDLGLEQAQVAEILGVHLNTVQTWERNHKAPYARHVPRIHSFLGYCPVDHEPFPARLRCVREALGLGQRELARRLGTSQQVLKDWEHGRYRPSARFRVGIRKLLGVDPGRSGAGR